MRKYTCPVSLTTNKVPSLLECIKIPTGLCQLCCFVITTKTKTLMSLPVPCHLKLNAK
jgi:hypothetical protein